MEAYETLARQTFEEICARNDFNNTDPDMKLTLTPEINTANTTQ